MAMHSKSISAITHCPAAGVLLPLNVRTKMSGKPALNEGETVMVIFWFLLNI